MNKTKIILWIIIIVIIIGGLWYGQGKKAEKESKNKLEVAVIIPLTGPSSPEGEDFLNGLLLAKEKLNPDIIFYIEDSQGKATEGLTAAKKLLDTKNIDIIVSFQSLVSIPLLALADQYNKPLVVTSVAQDEFTQKSKNAFRLFPTARQYASMAAEFANKKGYKNVSILTVHDEYGESVKEQFKKNFKGSIVHQESFEIPERDFRTVLIKISNSEAVFSVGYNIHWVSLFKQREELGKDTIFISNQNMVSQLVRSEIDDLLTNAYAVVPSSTLLSDTTKEFVDEYIKKYGHEPDWVAPFGYDMTFVLDAVQKNGKKPIEALHEIRFEGLNGTISFDENGESNIPLIMIQAKDGSIELVEK